MRSLGRGLRLRFLRGGQSWRVESSPSWDEGVRYRFAGSGEDLGDEPMEVKSEHSETSPSRMNGRFDIVVARRGGRDASG